jgi:hypothetical protein
MELIIMERIDKRKARRLFDEGKTILFVHCKLNPNSMWSVGIEATKNVSTDYDFDTFCNAVEFYNCSYETGYYLSYYLI